MLRKILVLAGPRSDPKCAAVSRASALARRAGAVIVLLGVVYDPHLEGYLGRSDLYASLRDRLVAERQQRLDAIAAELNAAGLQCETKAVWEARPHMAAVREASADDVDLVIVEPEDSQGLSQDEWRLVSLSPAPVLVARDVAARPYEVVVAAVDPERTNDKPADLDAGILEFAKRMRDLTGARLEVVHCVPPLQAFIADATAALGEAEKSLKAQRRRELDALVREAQLPSEAAALVEGKSADVLTAKSASDEATLILLGTVQRGPIARLLVGSTVERVLRTGGGDVLVIRPAFIADADGTTDDSSSRHVESDPSEVA